MTEMLQLLARVTSDRPTEVAKGVIQALALASSNLVTGPERLELAGIHVGASQRLAVLVLEGAGVLPPRLPAMPATGL